MNKRLVQRAMQKLVDQNPSRPLHQHTTITPTTTITPSTTTPRTLSQGNATLMASSAEAEEANRALTPGSGAGRPWDGEPADEGSEDAWSLTVRLLLVGAGWGLVRGRCPPFRENGTYCS